jgi:L-ascorbate metabolism protein UlaG (beta-lactamase superfamily)
MTSSALALLLLWFAGTETPPPPAPQVEITYLANEGFLLRSGDDAVLIDAFVGMPYAGYPALPAAVLKKLEQGLPPFAGVDLALASHVHGDHFQPKPARLFMAAVPGAMFVSSPQVIEGFSKDHAPASRLADRLKTVMPPAGDRTRFRRGGVEIEVLHLSHGTGRFASIQNLGHLIRIGGMTILHVGDAAIDPRNFAPYALADAGVDIALLPYWYWQSGRGRALIEEHLKADVHVACHVPVKDRAALVSSLREQVQGLVVFDRSLEAKRFEGSRRP